MSELSHHCRECKTRYHGKLHGINNDTLDTLDASKTCNIYKKGQRLIQEGTRPLGVYCIKSGKVKVFKLGQQGKEFVQYFRSIYQQGMRVKNTSRWITGIRILPFAFHPGLFQQRFRRHQKISY